MARIVEPPLPEPRYTYGGDEFLFCEIDEAMSFHANFKALAVCHALRERSLPGIVEVAPANASYLVRLDPDRIRSDDLLRELRKIYDEVGAESSFRTRLVDVPTFYDDPWTRECLMNFRDRHQNPEGTDLEYVARINGMTTGEFVAAHHSSPYYVSMVGFVPGTPWCFQMVPRETTIQVPKYIRPRTDTPERALAHGGSFVAIYPVRGPGGYQLFARIAPPIFEPTQTLPDFQDVFVFPRHGDIFKFRPIDHEEYDAIRAQVEEGTFLHGLFLLALGAVVGPELLPRVEASSEFEPEPEPDPKSLEELLRGEHTPATRPLDGRTDVPRAANGQIWRDAQHAHGFTGKREPTGDENCIRARLERLGERFTHAKAAGGG